MCRTTRWKCIGERDRVAGNAGKRARERVFKKKEEKGVSIDGWVERAVAARNKKKERLSG